MKIVFFEKLFKAPEYRIFLGHYPVVVAHIRPVLSLVINVRDPNSAILWLLLVIDALTKQSLHIVLKVLLWDFHSDKVSIEFVAFLSFVEGYAIHDLHNWQLIVLSLVGELVYLIIILGILNFNEKGFGLKFPFLGLSMSHYTPTFWRIATHMFWLWYSI